MSMRLLKKSVQGEGGINAWGLLAAVLSNLDTEMVFERKDSETGNPIEEKVPAIQVKRDEGGGISCCLPAELVRHFSENPHRVEVLKATISDQKIPAVVIAFTPQKNGPQLVNVNGAPIASESETLKNAINEQDPK